MKKLLLLFIVPFLSFGQDLKHVNEEIQEIKNYYSIALETFNEGQISQSALAGKQRECIDKYDTLLNNYYQILKDILPKNCFNILREGQRGWVQLRDQKETFTKSAYETGWSPNNWNHGIVETEIEAMYIIRVKELFEYINYQYSLGDDTQANPLTEENCK